MQKFLPKKPDKEVTTIRVSKELLDQVDREAAACGISRNEFINQCISYALNNMVDDDGEKQK